MPVEEEVRFVSHVDGSGRPTPEISEATTTNCFSGLTALGWSAGIALLTALATCAGMIRESGRSSALALYSLARPAIDQKDTYKGLNCILSAVLAMLVPFVIAWFVYRFGVWLLRKTKLHGRLSSWKSGLDRFLPWIALLIVVVDVGLLNASVGRLMNQAEGIILKHAADAGTVWTAILLDEDLGAASVYILLFGTGMALFVGISWWLIATRVKRRLSKIAFSLWAGVQVLLLVFGFSYLFGVADTIGEFPIVTFSGSQQLAPHSCSLLVGSDDKQFALLIVNCQAKPDELQKYVVYVPRTEVKWMAVTRVAQLQPLARLDDLKKLAE